MEPGCRQASLNACEVIRGRTQSVQAGGTEPRDPKNRRPKPCAGGPGRSSIGVDGRGWRPEPAGPQLKTRGPLRQLRQGHGKAERGRVGLGISCESWALEFSGALEASTVRMGISAKKQLFGPVWSGVPEQTGFSASCREGQDFCRWRIERFLPDHRCAIISASLG